MPNDTITPVAEIEIKLISAPATLETALASDVLTKFAAGDIRQTKLDATYFDTPDSGLLKKGWTLRVRLTDADQSTMTLKTPLDGVGSGGIGRSEWNAPTAGHQLDLATLALWLDKLGASDIDIACLLPLFQTVVCRRTCTLNTGNGVIELAADTGQLMAGTLRLGICEIELELVSGLPESIFDVAKALAVEFPLHLATRSKAVRGYDLALGQSPDAVKAGKLTFNASAPLDEALHLAFQSIFAHAMANLTPAESGAGPEGVHQLRVALRRLRSLLSAVGVVIPSQTCDTLRSDAKWLMSELGPAREWRVFADGLLREADQACAPNIDFAVLSASAKLQQQKAGARAQAALQSSRTTLFLIALGGWITRRGWRDGASTDALALFLEPAAKLAQHLLRQHYRKVLKKGRGFRRLDANALHETRLALKKLRYISDIFAPFLADANNEKQFSKRMMQLQDAFGQYNDLHVSLNLLNHMRSDHPRRMPANLALALGAAYGWQASREQQTIRILYKQWSKFRDIKPL